MRLWHGPGGGASVVVKELRILTPMRYVHAGRDEIVAKSL